MFEKMNKFFLQHPIPTEDFKSLDPTPYQIAYLHEPTFIDRIDSYFSYLVGNSIIKMF